MPQRAAINPCWLFIGIGVLLTGLGAYEYFAANIGQSEAARAWKSGSAAEQPVPQTLPRSTRKPVAYFNPYRIGDTVAKLRLPRLDTTLYVFEGTDQKELKRGPGHMPVTALPGVDGNCVIAGHRDTHFRVLEGIRTGDTVELETQYGRFHYQVRSMEIVSPTNVHSLFPASTGLLHLITCLSIPICRTCTQANGN